MEYHGWLFVGKDGELYRAAFDPSDQAWFGGWTVTEVRLEWWGAAYPPPSQEED